MLDVIIPTKNRSFWDCVESLLKISLVHRILICDGGSTAPEAVKMLRLAQTYPQIEVYEYPESLFNKSRLLNRGILHSQAPFVLTSDADILWNLQAIQALLSQVQQQPDSLCIVAQVSESEPRTIALQRQRYRYLIQRSAGRICLTFEPVKPDALERPGCGLVCGDRRTFFDLGGYREIFQGWGWEDQDLLIRAAILGFGVNQAGSVIHQSHDDALRNQFHGERSPLVTRNRNLKLCLKGLRQQQFYGDLPCSQPKLSPSLPLHIQVPPDLMLSES